MANGIMNRGLGTKIQDNRGHGANESNLVNAIDDLRLLEAYRESFKKLSKGTMDLPSFLQQLAPDMIKGLLLTAADEKTTPKLRTQIQQDILDRSGFGKINKAVNITASVDPTTTKRELVNLILTKAKKAGIKTQRKEYEQDSDTTIDVTPRVSKQANATADSYSDAEQVRGEGQEPSPDDSDN